MQFYIQVHIFTAWTANFEQQQQQPSGSGASSEGGPVAMDTSPWDNNNQSEQPKSGQQGWASWTEFNKDETDPEKKENWADFSNKIPDDGKNKDNWADFDNIDKR